MCTEGRWIESKLLCLTKQNIPKQNFTHNSSSVDLKFEPRGLMAENNNFYRTIRKKIYAVLFTI